MGEALESEATAKVHELGPSLKLSVLVPVYNERHLVEASLRRVLALKHKLIRRLEVIAVDDCSTDGSLAVLENLASQDERLQVIRHRENRGKGAAVRTALEAATGDVCIVHDADLEYHPADIPALLVPFVEEGADAVFGSRYLAGSYRRALMYRHSLMNRGLTALSNWLTDLDLTDMETCYKAVRTPIHKSIPLRSTDFRFEVEIVSKLAKRRARIFEVPIRYMPRSYEEGKKISAKDGLLALTAMAHFTVIDDLYKPDEYGTQLMAELERSPRFVEWKADSLRPFIGDRVLEIGAGIGTLTNRLIPRESYIATEHNPNFLHYLKAYSSGKPYLRISSFDPADSESFRRLDGPFDTVIMVNGLEHLADDAAALEAIFGLLEPGGRFIGVVPHNPSLYGAMDEALEIRQRYTKQGLGRALDEAGFEVEQLFDFNRFSTPLWWLGSRVLRQSRFSKLQRKVMDSLVPMARRVEHRLPWSGQSLIVVARPKPR